ncbi:SusC/RagA family TonB-linked outer membrane protein [Formosa algae]|uniref:Iron complex outermembrane receptor protein n=1 Tax=Formosa algae TaxID=225843 RepID=A0A9X0YIT8_9FLAO|nr:TonB-dependent receptor [Formosa algae]MBP1839261.1 iron complex outermembrane receptor protein [Formosa algae]MDQ0334038.1 iron complex outermembrane receptor protein [Formosa algae]OEI79367.1 SusC/RagA family TonB-linked outer membrane protein [Formosa algae]
MKTIFNSVLLALFFVPTLVLAQTTVTGTVSENTSNLPIPGVNIIVKGTTSGTATDFDGNYALSVNEGDVLEFSYIGYKSQELTYAGQTTLNVKLLEDTAVLDEVVVIGYGSVKKEDLTGAVDMINSDDFNEGPVLSPQQLISGKVAGVSVTSGGGAPGEGQNIVIRGQGSLSLVGTPLYVIDGFPIDNGSVGGSRNPLNFINPSDIESMVVLKDASATAIYGSRAANGVILITTKKGKDSGFKFNLSSSATVSTPFNKVDVMSAEQFTTLIEQNGTDANIALLGSANTDWQDEIYSNAYGSDHAFSAIGNAFGTPIRASIGYSDQDGILKNDNLTRTTGALNIKPSLFDDHLKLDLNARGMYTENTFANTGAISSAIDFDPTQSVYDADSKYGGYFSWIDPNTGNKPSLAPTNPVALLDLVDDTSEVRRLVANAKVDYNLHFFEDLTATINIGIDKQNSHGRTVTSELIPTPDETWNGSRTSYTQEATNKLFDAYVTYAKTINEKNALTAVAGYSYQSFEYNNFSYDSEDEEDGVDYEFIDKSKNVLLSYFGRVNYTLNEKYLITASLRADASSKLNPDDRWGYFPSAALAWNIHKESFLEDTAVNELKLRLGYGEVGNVNGLDDYKFITSYTGSQSTANYQFGDSFYQTYRPSALNEDLRWEVAQTLNIGIDYALFSRRLSGSVNVYSKKTKDLISDSFVDPFTNFGNQIEANIGDMENKGIEFNLNVIPVRNDNFEWSLNYNIAFNDNEITNLPDQQYVGGISGGTGNTVQTHVEGEAPYSFLVYEQVYDSSGTPIEGAYVDRNGDNIINDDDRYINHDPYADVTMGLSTNLSYKKWDLAVVTRANIGNYVYNNVASRAGTLNRATENGILTNLHTDYYDTGFQSLTDNGLQSDHYVQDASFFKLDNITLGYTLTEAIKNTTFRFYGSVQNVLTVTDYDGLDPEVYGGIDNDFYPRPRTYVLGVNIDF